jgi:hypothetical protein
MYTCFELEWMSWQDTMFGYRRVSQSLTMNRRHEDKGKALQTHIRNLLNDYALTHLTYDYARFTQDAVAEVSSVPELV